MKEEEESSEYYQTNLISSEFSELTFLNTTTSTLIIIDKPWIFIYIIGFLLLPQWGTVIYNCIQHLEEVAYYLGITNAVLLPITFIFITISSCYSKEDKKGNALCLLSVVFLLVITLLTGIIMALRVNSGEFKSFELFEWVTYFCRFLMMIVVCFMLGIMRNLFGNNDRSFNIFSTSGLLLKKFGCLLFIGSSFLELYIIFGNVTFSERNFKLWNESNQDYNRADAILDAFFGFVALLNLISLLISWWYSDTLETNTSIKIRKVNLLLSLCTTLWAIIEVILGISFVNETDILADVSYLFVAISNTCLAYILFEIIRKKISEEE